jgi:hypothetical protein
MSLGPLARVGDALASSFHSTVLRRRWLCFVVLCVAFLVFGTCTLNLIFTFKANIELIAEYGSQALEDGALQQFIELILSAVVGMVAYIVFKACEHELVHGLLHPRHGASRPSSQAATVHDSMAARPPQTSSTPPKTLEP